MSHMGRGRQYRRRAVIAGLTALAGVAPACAALREVPGHWPLALTMGTGAAGSGFAAFGPAWGQSVQQMTRIPLAYRASGGSAANILLIEQEAAQLGMASLAVAAAAWNGDAAWAAKMVLHGFRVLFPIYEETLQIVASRNQAILKPADLTGALLGIGPPGSSGAVLVPPLLASLGITPSGFRNGDFAAQVKDVEAGRLAGCAFMEATPLPALAEAVRQARFNLLGFTGAEIDAMCKTFPELNPAIIPAHDLPGQMVPVATIGSRAIALCGKELPEGLAAAVTRAAIGRRLPGLGHPDRNGLAGAAGLRVHPGAVAVLRQAGIAVPDQAAPERQSREKSW
jgi:TRAP transporter TAXI family solute receptor